MKEGWTTISSVNGRITLKDIMDDKSQPFSSINVESHRGVSRVVKARFNRLTRVSNVEPFAYEDE